MLDRVPMAVVSCALLAIPFAELSGQGAQEGQVPVMPPMRLAAVDVYGTDRLTAEDIEERFGADIDSALAALGTGRPAVGSGLLSAIGDSLRQTGPFAHVSISPTGYPRDGELVMYVTVDVVERADSARRMDFRPRPTGHVEGADSLLEAWRAYEELAIPRIMSGRTAVGPDGCPALHCLAGFEADELRDFLPIFEEGVPRQRDLLARVLSEDADPARRTRAAYLLAHADDDAWVASTLAASIRDPADGVRNAVMRVLGVGLQAEPTLPVPLDPVLLAADFPESSDRNKALLILNGLAADPEKARRIIQEGSDVLLATLKLQQPNNHGWALQLLQRLSGEDFAPRDYEAWERWLKEARGDTGIEGRPEGPGAEK